MFEPNKYTTWYFSIISNRLSNPLTQNYIEKHHIIPKSLGGSNKIENIVSLTYREHFLCHWLLTKMVNGIYKQKMIYALWRMTQCNKKVRRIVSSFQYDIARKSFSSSRKGKTYDQIYGTKKSLEMKQKLSIAHKGMKKPNSKIPKDHKLTTKKWKITLPNNKEIIIENLAQFCRKHSLNQCNFSTYGKDKGYFATCLS